MADQTTDQAQGASPALAEPTIHVRNGWVAGLGLASLGMWMASYTPLQVLLPTQLQDIDPHGKIVALAVVSGFGAIASGIATPIAGALSDNTTSRFALGRMAGRRHRWTRGMAVLAAVCLVGLSQMRTVLGVTLLWVLFSAFQNGEFASLSAAIPDHVPVRQRATVAGWVGMPQALGLVVGTILVVAVFTGLTSGYVVLAVLMAVLVLPVCRAPPARLPAGGRAPQAVLLARAGALLLDQPPRVPGLRLGLVHQVPDVAGDRDGNPVPAVLPPGQDPLRQALPWSGRRRRAADPDRDLHGRCRADGHRRRDDLGPARPPQDDGPDLRHRDRRGSAAAHVRGDLDLIDRRRRPFRHRLRLF